MTHAEQIKNVLENSAIPLSRAEVAQRTGLTRDQVKKVLHQVLKTGQIKREVDHNGIEWLSAVGAEAPKEKEEAVTGKQEDVIDVEVEWDAYHAGIKTGRVQMWNEIGFALMDKFSEIFGVKP